MKLGIDRLKSEHLNLLKNKRIGILAHSASITSNSKHITDLLKDQNITAYFGPEHGLTTVAQDMEPVKNSTHNNIKVFSLYGDSFASLSPTKEMLDEIDILVIDLQDIGSRYYTYVWTMMLAIKECTKYRKEVVICDRPNPINGNIIEGISQQKGFESFVGLYQIPVRHGLTIAEISNYVTKKYSLDYKYHIIKMDGWKRKFNWNDTGLKWHNPSPNMRSYHAALLYPGMCLIEGTNLSEGRGTDAPFEKIGAPFIDSDELINEFERFALPGISLQPIEFVPTMQKWKEEKCNGVKLQITNEKTFQSYLTGLYFIWCVNKLYKDKGFKWRTETYEFIKDIPAIDLLTGSDFFRNNIDTDPTNFEKLANIGEYRDGVMLY